MNERYADNLIWVDLEFTSLDSPTAGIMQAAMIVTRADLTPLPPPGVPPEVGGLSFDVAITPEQAAGASPWVQANQAEQVQRSLGPDALPAEKVEELFVAYLLSHSEVPEPKHLRPLLAGNSIHGDLRFIARQMPALERLLSFRLLDVTTLKELTRRWCPTLEFKKNTESIRRWYPSPIDVEGGAHDALFDIKGSIAELNYYRTHLFAEVARKPPSAPAAGAAAAGDAPSGAGASR